VGRHSRYGIDAPPRPTVLGMLFSAGAAITVTMLSDADTALGNIGQREGMLRTSTPEIRRSRTFSIVYSARWARGDFNVILIGLFGMVALILARAGVLA